MAEPKKKKAKHNSVLEIVPESQKEPKPGEEIPPKNDVKVLHENGDVLLDVYEESSQSTNTEFIVDSRTISRHFPSKSIRLKPRSRRLFDEAWKYGANFSLEVDGSSKGWHILLSIAHGRFENVPAILSVDELFDVVSIVWSDAAEALYLLRPYAKAWIAPLIDQLPQIMSTSRTAEKLTFIAEHLGSFEMHAKVVAIVAQNSGEDEQVQLENDVKKHPVVDITDCDMITDLTLERRLELIEALSAPYKSLYDFISGRDRKTDHIRVCTSASQDQNVCGDLALGSLMRVLANTSFFNSEADKYLGSPIKYQAFLSRIKIRSMADVDGSVLGGCWGVVPALQPLGSEDHTSLLQRYPKSFLEAMRTKGQITGLANAITGQ